MTVHFHDFRPEQNSERKAAPETLSALLDYIAKDIDPTRYGVAHDLVVAAAQWLRLQSD